VTGRFPHPFSPLDGLQVKYFVKALLHMDKFLKEYVVVAVMIVAVVFGLKIVFSLWEGRNMSL
jgi:hypothetical protein